MWQLVTMALSTATISSSVMQETLVIDIGSIRIKKILGETQYMKELMVNIMVQEDIIFTLAMRPMNHPRLTIISPAIFWMISLRLK